MLGTLILALDDNAGGKVGDADGRFSFIDVLATGPGGAKGVNPDLIRFNLNVVDLFGLWKHGHRAGGGVDAATRFGLRNALHPVGAPLELQTGIDLLTGDLGNDLLKAAVLPFVCRDDLHLPAAPLGIAAIHPEEIASKERRFRPSGAGTDFEVDVAVVVGVFGEE